MAEYCVCVYIVHDNCVASVETFSYSLNFFYILPPLFMYFDSVGLSSHQQKTTVTDDVGGSDEEKTAGNMDVDDCHELR